MSTNYLPIFASDVVTQGNLKAFSEFSDIFVPHLECEVGLLIRNDNLRVFQPLEDVTTSEEATPLKLVLDGLLTVLIGESQTKRQKPSFLSLVQWT